MIVSGGEMDMKVTIVIPIHNSQKYLMECIESARSQSFNDLEILCIDGGSTDDSREIVKKMQEVDKRIIDIYDTNTSYGHKINLGIDRARGKYIAILESDDRMDPNMIENLYHIAERYNTDITDADYYEFLDYKNNELKHVKCKYDDKDYDHLINYEDGAERNIATVGIWTALYKKSFLIEQNIRLNESSGASYQDLSFLFLTSLLAKKVYHTHFPLYQYRVDNIESSVKDDNKIFEVVKECEFLKKDLKIRGITDKDKWHLYYIRKYNSFYWNYCRLSVKSKEIFLKKYIKELEDDLNRGSINREMFSPFLYDRTFLLIDNKEKFIQIAAGNFGRPFLVRVYKSLDKIGENEVVLVGAGSFGTTLIHILLQSKVHVRSICDNSLECQGKILDGYKVVSVKQAVEDFPQAIYFITSPKYGKELFAQLLAEGIKENDITIF